MLVLCPAAWSFEDSDGILSRFLDRMAGELKQLPDYVCAQEIERFSRQGSENPWNRIDSLRLEVAMSGNKELYSLPGDRRFTERPLRAFIGRGSIGTGQLGLLAQHVFLTSTGQFTDRGESDLKGRRVREFGFDVPAERSSYRLSFGNSESAVAFQGSFFIDPETLDLVRLDVQAYDIPESLAIVEANTSLDYARMVVDGNNMTLPIQASLTVTATDGREDLNRTVLSGCRHYQTESTIAFDTSSAGAGDAERALPVPSVVPQALSKPSALPGGTLLDLTLDTNLDPSTVAVGDTVTASIAHAIRDVLGNVIPQGTPVTGHVVRLEKATMPFAMYSVGLEFQALKHPGGTIPFDATMIEAGPAAGLLRQEKSLDPTFTRNRGAHIDVLVREVQRGQGILMWDARKGTIPHGLRMKWRVLEVPASTGGNK
ncbi:MAG TPA: hypothetical protein VKU01_33375 [Bryobacteraceae bacterium]|nr:hypothetical protein [Bryobacteraceae bacterium]